MDFQNDRINKLAGRLRRTKAGCSLVYEEETASTNDTAGQARKAGCKTPCVFLTDYQTAGRGRFDRVWMSSKGSSLTFSLLFEPECRTDCFPMLTEVFAIAVCDALSKLYGCKAQIKWPNDVVLQNRKVCGILTLATSDLKAVIIGAGTNLTAASYPKELCDVAISIEEACGAARDAGTGKVSYGNIARAVNGDDLLCEIVDSFFTRYETFLRTCDMSLLKEDYDRLLINIGRPASLVRGSDREGGTEKSPVAGKALGTDRFGRLVFLTEDGSVLHVGAGEVSVRGIYGQGG